MKSRLIVPEDCPEATVNVNGGAILCGINLLATIGMVEVAVFVKSAMAKAISVALPPFGTVDGAVNVD